MSTTNLDPSSRTPHRRVDSGRLTLGLIAVVVGAICAGVELTRIALPWDHLEGWQVMTAIGVACVIFGLLGLVFRRSGAE